ncbi:hypothetical protein M405DRAFT_820260, partial [Rhizopogon salebrosus TDB-379]
FFVVLKDDLFCVTTSNNARMVDVFEELKSNAGHRILVPSTVARSSGHACVRAIGKNLINIIPCMYFQQR